MANFLQDKYVTGLQSGKYDSIEAAAKDMGRFLGGMNLAVPNHGTPLFDDPEKSLHQQLNRFPGPGSPTSNRPDKSLGGLGKGGVFHEETAIVLDSIARNLQIPKENRVGRLAALKYVAEENTAGQDRRGLKRFLDSAQDKAAMLGIGKTDFRNYVAPHAPFPFDPKTVNFVPEDFLRAGTFKKLLTRPDISLHDIGPANIKLKTALEKLNVRSSSLVDPIRRAILTTEGSALIVGMLVESAQDDLGSLIKDLPERDQSQIIVDYLRNGREHFWWRVRKERQLTDVEFKKWKANPDTFRDSGGNSPRPLKSKKYENVDYEELERLELIYRSAP